MFPNTCASHHILHRHHTRNTLRLLRQQESAFLDTAFQDAKNEHTQLAKADLSNPRHQAIDKSHTLLAKQPNLAKHGHNISYGIHSSLKQACQCVARYTKHIQFANTHTVRLFLPTSSPTVFATLDSGTDRHYLSQWDRTIAKLPILHPSSKCGGVANGSSSQG